MRCASVGPRDAGIVVIGEAPGREEEASGQPFVGVSGEELSRMLAEAGIVRSRCFITNAVKERPADNKLGLWIKSLQMRRTASHGEPDHALRFLWERK